MALALHPEQVHSSTERAFWLLLRFFPFSSVGELEANLYANLCSLCGLAGSGTMKSFGKSSAAIMTKVKKMPKIHIFTSI